MYVASLWPVALGLLATIASAKPTPTRTRPAKRNNGNIKYVTTENGKFSVNGAPLDFVGTNAYWLPTLTDEDIDKTLAEIADAGIKVVRTWAFNDVTSVPEDNSTWFQLISENGQVSINDGPTGLQKLDTVVKLAEKHGLYLLLSLTNNWSLDPLTVNATTGSGSVTRRDNTGTNLTRNALSNDYGGMDTYVRQFGGPQKHDQFYTNKTIVDAFKNYTGIIAKRYSNNSAVFAWELANDPRCNSTVAAPDCNPQVVTRWHADLSAHVKSVDPNHLVSSGAGGFFCVDCPKLFPRAPPPPPQVSPAPGQRRRSLGGFLTRSRIITERVALRKRNRILNKRAASGTQIRGRWMSTPTRRQDQELGSVFDGSFGVDSEDILNAPDVSFGSFQLFPDQVKYAPDDPNLSQYENLVQQGVTWIERHADAAQSFGKPVILNGFGLVTQANVPQFRPFSSGSASVSPTTQQPFGVTDEQRDEAYSRWLSTGSTNGLESMIQYQWGQDGLTVSPGTPVSAVTPSTGIDQSDGTTGVSPNDGYAINGQGRADAIDVLEQSAQNFASDS